MRILSFDVESNGLHGDAFAAGAVVLGGEGSVLEKFEGRCPIQGDVDPWVEQNVLPALDGAGMRISFASAKEMRSAFWAWFTAQKDGSIVVADVGYPVETGFLRSCQRDALDERMWGGPYPLHEVATLLFASRVDPDIPREGFVGEEISGREVRKHHPTWDAEVSALCALKCFRALGLIG